MPTYTFLQILELLVVPSIQKRTRVSWLFIRHIKEKGGRQGSRECYIEYKRGGGQKLILAVTRPSSKQQTWDRRISESIIRSVEHGSGIIARESPIF